MDPTIVGLVVFTIIVLVVIWVFRHRIKIAIKGSAGMSLEVEAENVPPKQVPNATGINQTGDRSVVAGGDITHSKVTTGDRNVVADVVLTVETPDADVVDRITERVSLLQIPSGAEILVFWRDTCPDASAERVCWSTGQLGVRTD